MLVQKRGNAVSGINRSGLVVALPGPIAAAAAAITAESCLLDGEAVGDIYHAFDLLERDGTDLKGQPYALRYDGAMDLVVPPCLNARSVSKRRRWRYFKRRSALAQRGAAGLTRPRRAAGAQGGDGPCTTTGWRVELRHL